MGPCSLLWPGTAKPWAHLFHPNCLTAHSDFSVRDCFWIWQHLFTDFFLLQKPCPVGSWQAKLFPSPLPAFSCIPQRPGEQWAAEGSLPAPIANFWWSHSFTTTDTRQTGAVSKQICSRGLPLLLARIIPGMTFSIWTHCRKALARWAQQCLYKSSQYMTDSS